MCRSIAIPTLPAGLSQPANSSCNLIQHLPVPYLCHLAELRMSGKTGSVQDFLLDFMMGGVAAAVSKTAAAPIERVKLLIQNQDEMIKQGRLATPYTGISECFKRTIADEGFNSLWCVKRDGGASKSARSAIRPQSGCSLAFGTSARAQHCLRFSSMGHVLRTDSFCLSGMSPANNDRHFPLSTAHFRLQARKHPQRAALFPHPGPELRVQGSVQAHGEDQATARPHSAFCFSSARPSPLTFAPPRARPPLRFPVSLPRSSPCPRLTPTGRPWPPTSRPAASPAPCPWPSCTPSTTPVPASPTTPSLPR